MYSVGFAQIQTYSTKTLFNKQTTTKLSTVTSSSSKLHTFHLDNWRSRFCSPYQTLKNQTHFLRFGTLSFESGLWTRSAAAVNQSPHTLSPTTLTHNPYPYTICLIQQPANRIIHFAVIETFRFLQTCSSTTKHYIMKLPSTSKSVGPPASSNTPGSVLLAQWLR